MANNIFPQAEWLANGVSGGSWTGGPYRIVLHTTETKTLPDYNDGFAAPHITYNPLSRIFYQHTSFVSASRSLLNPSGGVETNRRSALQIEIICYSSHSTAALVDGLWVGDLPDSAYEDLAGLCNWLCVEFDVEKVARMPRPTPKYGVDSPARMSPVEWNSFNGLCGHFEVPENTHWDTGAFDFVRLLDFMKEDVMTPEQEAKLDKALALVDDIHKVLAIADNADGQPRIRTTNHTYGWFVRNLAKLTSLEFAGRLLTSGPVDEGE